MKSLIKKPWFKDVAIIGLMLLVFLLNLWVLSFRLRAPYEEENLFSLAEDVSSGGLVRFFSYVIVILFYVSILPLLLTGLSILRKNHWGIITGIVYLLGFSTILIVFQSLFNRLTIFAVILTVLNILLIGNTVVLLVLRRKTMGVLPSDETDQSGSSIHQTKIPRYVLFINVTAVVVFFTTFVTPLYSLPEAGNIYNAILINVLFTGDVHLDVSIYFLINFVILLSILLYFADVLSNYFFDKERFMHKSQTLINFAFISTVAFFITGLAMVMYYSLQGEIAQSFAFIPLVLMVVVVFTYATMKGKLFAHLNIKNEVVKARYAKIEPLIYVFLLTAVTVLMLMLQIIKIDIVSGGITYDLNLTGIDLLRDYTILDEGYRLVAFILVVMLVASGLCLVTAISSYLSKYRRFDSIVKLTASVNVFFVFIIAISGYYFQIAKEINLEIMFDIIGLYGISIPNSIDFDYNITTDAIYALIASAAILAVMFARQAFDRDELILNGAMTSAISLPTDTAPNESSGTADEDIYHTFDPCPAFTELDMKQQTFIDDLKQRKFLATTETTLNNLVNFVVDYARNSRLHLSYTPEDIATFVAGLGASRLSILQGMSGTGKTSLPKIFSEAIFGNCEIIEVESSWKDKNELLGYYNEFSMKYAPKKFTLALYKAALNPEIFTMILLDEMNLSRIEYYFSDFLSLMENEEHQRWIKLINIKLSRKENNDEIEYLALDEGYTLKVPPNVWFIGTANRDESTFVISDKVYDRAHTMNFTKRAPKIRNYANPMPQQYHDYQTINNLFIEAKSKGTFDAEQSELIKSVEKLLAPYNISFGNRILKQIEEFVNIYTACFSNEDVENEAIEKILLSKVVAKLEVKTIEDKEKLEMAFEELNLKQCVDFIQRLDDE